MSLFFFRILHKARVLEIKMSYIIVVLVAFFQFSFQAVLATDGDMSFAIFHYEIGNKVLGLRPQDGMRIGVIGFDAGNKIAALEEEIRSDRGQYLGIFRIDGVCRASCRYFHVGPAEFFRAKNILEFCEGPSTPLHYAGVKELVSKLKVEVSVRESMG